MRLFGKNKRGIELAVNFLVTFILAVVIFGAGLVLIRTMVTNSGDDLDKIQGDLDRKIQALSCSAKDKLCLANNEATIGRGKILYFTANVNNYLTTSMNFTITINMTSVKAYDGHQDLIDKDDIAIKALPTQQRVEIKPKKQAGKAFGMVIPKDVTSGQYFYTISVVADDDRNYKKVSDTLIFTVR